MSAERMIQTKPSRQACIAMLLARHAVKSQSELADLLTAEGIETTQATLSRDLDELGAVKVPGPDGEPVYAVPGEGGDPSPVAAVSDRDALARLSRLAEELMVSVEGSANIVVLRTPPGAAQFLASAIDHTVLPALLGSVAGDDTVLLVTRDPQGGEALASELLDLVGRRR